MGSVQVRSLDQPDETRSFPNGAIEMVTIADTMIGRARFEPGWRWSNDVKPIAGTDWCGFLSEDPQRLTEYYTRLFGEPGWAGGDFRGCQLGTGYLTVGPHDLVHGPNPQPGRLIWNLETPDVHGDFQRLKAGGATVVQEPYQPDEDPEGWIATFADPDDNYFQLVSPFPG